MPGFININAVAQASESIQLSAMTEALKILLNKDNEEQSLQTPKKCLKQQFFGCLQKSWICQR